MTNLLKKIAIITGVDDSGGKEIILAEPVADYSRPPRWLVKLTQEEVRELSEILAHEARAIETKK